MPRSRDSFLHQLENLRLNGHVKRRRRFVGDDEFRIAGKPDGDHDALAHTAGKLSADIAACAPRDRISPPTPAIRWRA